MLSSVLRSRRAIDVNIAIMRPSFRLRKMLLSHDVLARKLTAIERKYDAQFRVVFDKIRKLMSPPVPRPVIGFRPRAGEGSGNRGASVWFPDCRELPLELPPPVDLAVPGVAL